MTYHLNARWDARNEALSACATRFARMLQGLAAVHPNLADWRRKAHTLATAYKPFCTMPPSQTELEAILLRGRYFASASRELIADLGYSASTWNGLDDPQGLSLRLHVGAYSRRLYPNEVEIEGLRPGNALVDAAILKRVLLTLAECWDADWGVVETWAYEGLTVDANDKPLLPYGGWLTYLSHELAQKVSPPRDVLAERTPDGGLFMLVSEEPFDAANPTHVTRLDAIQKSLAPVQRSLSSVSYAPPSSNK
jgi:hypothetical protein